MRKRIIYGLSLVLCVGLIAGVFSFGSGRTFPGSFGQRAKIDFIGPELVGSGQVSALKVTVTKVELWNGAVWVVIFSGSSELDLVWFEYSSPARVQTGEPGPGTFPGIMDLAIPLGTYSQVRVTFLNSYYVEGWSNTSPVYHTTTTTLYDDTAILAATAIDVQAHINVVAGNGATIRNPNWGNLGDPVARTFPIDPINVTAETDYQPTLKFDAKDNLELYKLQDTYYFILKEPTISII